MSSFHGSLSHMWQYFRAVHDDFLKLKLNTKFEKQDR